MSIRLAGMLTLAVLLLAVGMFVFTNTQTPQDGDSPWNADHDAAVTRVQTATADVDDALTRDLSLAARLQELERTVARMDRSNQVNDLMKRVTDLERTTRKLDQVTFSKPSSARSVQNDIAQLKRDNSSLKRAHDQLASRVSSNKSANSPFQNDLRQLQQKVFSLELKVQRLESRR